MNKRSRINRIYRNMINRCYNVSVPQYKNYGGRGITICEEWNNKEQIKDLQGKPTKGFLAFQTWALQSGYCDNLTLDRIDVNKNYSPSNCRWVTRKTQSNNKRNNILITYANKTQALALWCEELQLPYKIIRDRLQKQHWSVEKALETPIRKCHKCLVTYRGRTETLEQWCRELKLKYVTAYYRLNTAHWSVEKTFQTDF